MAQQANEQQEHLPKSPKTETKKEEAKAKEEAARNTGVASSINTKQIAGSTYYVSTTGSDSNPGTIAQPFVTINHGASVLQPGDTLYIRGGTYAEFLNNVVPSGTSWASPVTIAACQGETVTIEASGSGGNGMIKCAGRQYIIFQNLILDGANLTGSASAIVYLTGSGSVGSNHIRFIGCTSQGISGSNVQNFFIQDTGTAQSNYNEFIKCKAGGNNTNGLNHAWYIQGNCNLLDSCDAYDTGGEAIQIYKSAGVNGTDGGGNIIRNCKIHDSGKAKAGACGLVVGVGDGNLVYNNLICNNPTSIQVDYGASNSKIYNNICYNSTYAKDFGIRIGYMGGASNTTVENNIVWATAGSDAIANYGTGTVCSYNLGDKTMQNEGRGTGSFSHNLVGSSYNPLFVDPLAANFHLQAGSPAIDAGTMIALVAMDFDGIPRPQGAAYDIGAYEYH
jgi:hypothetical protein